MRLGWGWAHCDISQTRSEDWGLSRSIQAHRVQEFLWRPRTRLARALRAQWCTQDPDSFHSNALPLKLLTTNHLCNYTSVSDFTFLVFHRLCSCILLHWDNIFLIFSNELLSQVLIAVLFQTRSWTTDV